MRAADLNSYSRQSISGERRVLQLLGRARDERVCLRNGMDSRNRERLAYVRSIDESVVVLDHKNIDISSQALLVFAFEIGGVEFSMAGTPIRRKRNSETIEIATPATIHIVERRGRLRRASRQNVTAVIGLDATRRIEDATVVDISKGGLGIRLDEVVPLESGMSVTVKSSAIAGASDFTQAMVRHSSSSNGKMRVGLVLNPVASREPIPVEKRTQILPGSVTTRRWTRFALASRSIQLQAAKALRSLGARPVGPTEISIVTFRNQLNQPIRGIVDRSFESRGGVGVVVPPAWGRTKETLLPLAQTLLRTFREAGQQISILRYDGTQRRGESYVDPECRARGSENLHFTYSQAAQDLIAAARYLRESEKIGAEKVALVTFSLAAIEGRIALVSSEDSPFDSWISVVGMTDVQSALKSVSGGIDFVLGKEAGVEFGIQELGGVKIDIDHAAEDVLTRDLATLEEAKRDVAKISCPISWIHGRDDGWTPLEQVAELLSPVSKAPRKIIEIPTGHQLRTSTEAIDAFQLVASEVVSSLDLGDVEPRLPDLKEIDTRRSAEKRRLRQTKPDLRDFWNDYLLGRDSTIGMELLGSTPFYRQFMDSQISALRLNDGLRILDLGCGTGEFGVRLKDSSSQPTNAHVVCTDFVQAALVRARKRTADSEKQTFSFCAADFNHPLPFSDQAFDRVVASLVVPYLERPDRLIADLYRVLRPGGILVVSCPRRDADLSSLYRQTIASVDPSSIQRAIDHPTQAKFEEIQRNYLNDAARLVDLEEQGFFLFRDAEELQNLVSRGGFVHVESYRALGDPPQAIIASGIRGN